MNKDSNVEIIDYARKSRKKSFSLRKNDVEILFFSIPDIFVDIIEAQYFNGMKTLTGELVLSVDTIATFIDEKENESHERRRDIFKLIDYVNSDGSIYTYYQGLEIETEKNLDMRMRLKMYDAGSYYRILDEAKKRYLVQTMTITFSTTYWESETLCEEYHVPESIQNGFDNTINQVLNVSTVDINLFKTSEMKILVTWYQIYIKDRKAAREYLETLDKQPKALIFVMASISEDMNLFDFIDYEVKGEYYNMKTMSEDLVNYGKIIGKTEGKIEGIFETTVNNVKNLVINTGWSIDKAMTMNGISDELKPKILEELSKNED
ncbi:MAG: hypothetical protein LUG12_13450 [Erysipelotrichaceae bacterium]|nr:hypothetical protein [Erysipelotrichaceae bacterium]